MDEFEELLLLAANKFKDDFESFCSFLLKNIDVSPNEITSLFIDVGSFLNKRSFFDLAISSYELAFNQSNTENNVADMILCCGGIGVVYNTRNVPIKAKKFFEKGALLAKQNNFVIKEAWFFSNLGTACFNLGEYSNAIDSNYQALASCIEDGDLFGTGICYGSIGTAFRCLKEYDKALECQTKALQISIKINDGAGQALCLTNIGNIYSDNHDYLSAIIYYKKALIIHSELSNYEGQAECHRNIGVQYCEMHEYNDAIQNLLIALNTYDMIINKMGIATCTLDLGNAYYSAKDYCNAIKCFFNALDVFQELENKKGIADCCSFLGIAYDQQCLYEDSINYAKRALKYFVELNDMPNQCKCFSNIGSVYSNMGDFLSAVEYLEKSIEISRSADYHIDDSSVFSNIGSSYRNIGKFIEAQEYCETALEIDRKAGDKYGEAISLVNLGNTYLAQGNFKKAIDCHTKSLALDNTEQAKQYYFTNIGNIYLEQGNYETAKNNFEKAIEYGHFNAHILLKSYISLGKVFDGLGQYKEAISNVEKAMEINNVINDSSEEIKCYIELWNIYIKTNQNLLAERNLEKAHLLILKSGNKLSEAIYYQCLSQKYLEHGDFDKALSIAGQAIEFTKKLSAPLNTVPIYNTIGSIYQNMGNFGRAVEYHEYALSILSGSGNLLAEAACCANLGVDYICLADYSKALAWEKKAFDLSITMGNKLAEATCSANIGLIYGNIFKYDDSIRYYEVSLDISKKIGSFKGMAISYLNMGRSYEGLGKIEKAIECTEKASSLYYKHGHEIDIAKCYLSLGGYDETFGNDHEALTKYLRAHDIAIRFKDMDFKRVAKFNLSRLYCDKFFDYERSYDLCKECIDILENISGRVIEEKNRISISSKNMVVYQYMIQICLKLGKAKEALEYLERSKSRAFIALLAATEIKSTVCLTHENQILLHEESKLLNKLNAIRISHISPNFARNNPDNTEDILKDLDDIYKKLVLLDPQYVSMRKSEPVMFDNILDQICSKHDEVTLIEYYITKDCVYIFILSSRDREVHVKRVDITETKLNRYVFEDYFKSIATRSFCDIGESWLALGQYLIDPIACYLHEGDTLCFIPYGCLHYLPLHALKMNDLRIIEQHPIVYLQSSSLMEFYNNKSSKRYERMASFGIDFEDEAEEIASVFGATPYLNNKATKEMFLTKCKNTDVIHFSCHGYFDADDPLSSGIKLYDDFLTAREIYNIRLETGLTVLSACETGFNKSATGDELIGLARAFLYAGTPSIVVSLWCVNAKSTKELMVAFYKNLKAGMSKAAALQCAQKKVMHEDSFEHPYYWAPFILIGNWD